MKYIITKNKDDQEEVFIFSRAINHDCMAEALRGFRNQTHGNWEIVHREPVSAGFINASFWCYGYSETLRLSSRPQDTAILVEHVSKNN